MIGVGFQHIKSWEVQLLGIENWSTVQNVQTGNNNIDPASGRWFTKQGHSLWWHSWWGVGVFTLGLDSSMWEEGLPLELYKNSAFPHCLEAESLFLCFLKQIINKSWPGAGAVSESRVTWAGQGSIRYSCEYYIAEMPKQTVYSVTKKTSLILNFFWGVDLGSLNLTLCSLNHCPLERCSNHSHIHNFPKPSLTAPRFLHKLARSSQIKMCMHPEWVLERKRNLPENDGLFPLTFFMYFMKRQNFPTYRCAVSGRNKKARSGLYNSQFPE